MIRHVSNHAFGNSDEDSTDSLLTPEAQAMLDAVEDYLADHPDHIDSIVVPLKDRRTYSSRAV